MLLDYCAERMPARLMVPVVACLALAARIDVRPLWSAGVATDALVLLLLVAQFRLWDDLADRRHDAVQHPGRVLVRAASDTAFRVVCALLATVNAATITVVYHTWTATMSLLALNAGMAFWYARRGARSTIGDHLLLLKYPAFVVVLASGRVVVHPWLVASGAAAVYLAACLYEAVHDPASPAGRNRILMACEACLLVVVSCVLLVIGAYS